MVETAQKAERSAAAFTTTREGLCLREGPTKDGIDAIVDKSSQLRPQPQSQQIEELERCCCLAAMAHVTMHGWPAIGHEEGLARSIDWGSWGGARGGGGGGGS